MTDAIARFLHEELGIGAAARDGPWTVTAPLWVWRGNGDGPPPKAAWYFVTIGGAVGADIRAATAGRVGGFGSVRVSATIGSTSWHTSLFPSREAGGYLLPVKASVRRAERLVADGPVTVTVLLALSPLTTGRSSR